MKNASAPFNPGERLTVPFASYPLRSCGGMDSLDLQKPGNAIRMLSSSISRILTWKAGTGKGAYPMERRYGTRIVLSATCVWMSCLASSTKCTRSRR